MYSPSQLANPQTNEQENNTYYSMHKWSYGFCYAAKANVNFWSEAIVKDLRSRVVKYSTSLGYWIAELRFKLRPPDSNIHIFYHYAMLTPSKQIVFLYKDTIQGSQVALMVKNLPANTEHIGDMGLSLGWEEPLEEGMESHSRILAWRIPWKEEPGGLWSIKSDTLKQLSMHAQRHLF